jgi:uncharacterized protein YegL
MNGVPNIRKIKGKCRTEALGSAGIDLAPTRGEAKERAMKRATTVLIIATLFGSPQAAEAGFVVPQENPKKPLVARDSRFAITVKNQVLQAILRQVFENQHPKPTEATFYQKVPEGAAVSRFAYWIGNRRVESKVQEKAKAKATYAAAKRAGQSAALLSQLSRNRFSMKLSTLLAGEQRRTELQYESLLTYKDGRVTLRVPLKAAVLPGGLKVSVSKLNVAIDIRDDKAITAVTSLSLPVKIARINDKHWRVTLALNKAPKRDLLLEYRLRSRDLGLTFVTHRQAGHDGYFMLLASPQELTSNKDIVKKDVVFVFDVSGSMTGEKLEQARGALKRCLQLMNRGDRFNILAFSDGVNPYATSLLGVDSKNRQSAFAFVDKLEANGGTNIDLALREGLKLFAKSKRPKVIVFLTDGEPTSGITDSGAILKAVKQANKKRARIFVFGVGDDVNRVLLERLGKHHRGAVDFVKHDASLKKAVASFYQKIARPVLSELSLAFGKIVTSMSYPQTLPDLYKGSQLVLIGRYRGDGKVDGTLDGELNRAKKRYRFAATFPKTSTQNAFLARLWARRRVGYLLSQMRMNGPNKEAKAEVIRLAKRYHLATRFTSLVAAAPIRVARLTPARIKPGDPEISVRAPRDARAVTLVFPFGVTKPARYEAARDVWTVRFLIPRGVADGSYPVTILVSLRDGSQRVFHVSYTVDTLAPQMKLTARGSLEAGKTVTFTAKQVVTEAELRQAPGYHNVRSRRMRRLYARSMLDTAHRDTAACQWDVAAAFAKEDRRLEGPAGKCRRPVSLAIR